MTLMDFYKSKANLFEKLTDYLRSYENNDFAIKIRNSYEDLTKFSKYNTKFIRAMYLKHILLEICIALIITIPFSSMGLFHGLKIFLITLTILTTASLLLLKHGNKLFVKFSNTRFDKLNEDVEKADMDALKQNYDGTKNTIDMFTNTISSTKEPLIFRFFNSYYFNGQYFEYCKFMEDYAFSINISCRTQVLNNMFIDIEKHCIEIYKQSNNDESTFFRNVMDKFNSKAFFESVFENTVFCDNAKLNKYMVLWSAAKIFKPFCNKDGEFDFNIAISWLNSCNTPEKRVDAYGSIGTVIVAFMIIEYGFSQIELDEAICQ